MSHTVKDMIIEQIGRLGDPQQRQVLDFARKLALPVGVPGQVATRDEHFKAVDGLAVENW